MNKTYSRLGWFVFGVITGVVGVFVYQVFGKPVEPEPKKVDYDKLVQNIIDAFYRTGRIICFSFFFCLSIVTLDKSDIIW